MRALSATVCLAAIVLSGCSGGSDDGATPTFDGTQGASSSPASGGATSRAPAPGAGGATTGPAPGSGGSRGNQDPKGTFTASVAAGPVPLTVSFTIDGSDADGDGLSWTLDADADGTADLKAEAPAKLPAVARFNYTTVGVYNATLRLSDGVATVTLTAKVNVTAAAAGKASFSVSGTVTGVDPSAVTGVPWTCFFGEQDIGGQWHPYTEDLTGWPYVITPEGKGFVTAFWKADGTTSAGEGGETGTVPAEAVEVDVCTADPSAHGVSYTFTATAP